MFHRLLNPPKKQSFLILGPRGSGKTTWLKNHFSRASSLWFDLLDSKTELELRRDPELVIKHWQALEVKPEVIIIDEVQKNPTLLDVTHRGIEEFHIHFVLTGSSARKLRRGAANLLAGRAFEFFLLPLSSFELADHFDLSVALNYGLLPKIYSDDLAEDLNKERYLYSYVSTYLKEEIAVEQVVRNLDPFQKFLEVAAQANGKIINYAKLGRDSGVDPKQVERYFSILADTLLGFFLQPYHRSVRKRQAQKAKFYFFDVGVVRTLTNRLPVAPVPSTFEFGDLFEHFIVLEFIKLNFALEKRFRFSYFHTDQNHEIDLVVETPDRRTLLIEIKSSLKINLAEVSTLASYKSDFTNPYLYYLSQDVDERVESDVLCLNWRSGLRRIFDLTV